MNRAIWIRNLSDVWPLWGHQPIAPIIKAQGFNRVILKALDGASWMSEFDPSADAVSGIASLQSWLQTFNGYGLAMDTFVNVTKADLVKAIPLYIAILEALPGRFILDLEPYADFWGDDSPLILPPTWPAAPGAPLMRALAPYQYKIGVSFDPRRMDWIAPTFTGCSWRLPQIYDPAWGAYLDDHEVGPTWEPTLTVANTQTQWSEILHSDLLGNVAGRSGFSIFAAPTNDNIAPWVKEAS